jgi:hypothetical protein
MPAHPLKNGAGLTSHVLQNAIRFVTAAESQPDRIKAQTKSVTRALLRLRGQKVETKYDAFLRKAENLGHRSMLPDGVG